MPELISKASDYNYGEWLRSLSVGDRLKTSSCSHKYGCNCEGVKVVDISIMFKKPVITIVDGCTMRYYSQENGRQLGGRSGAYKDGNILPWFQEDQDDFEKKQKMEKDKERKLELSNRLAFLMTGNKDHCIRYDLNNDMTLEQIEDTVLKLEASNVVVARN